MSHGDPFNLLKSCHVGSFTLLLSCFYTSLLHMRIVVHNLNILRKKSAILIEKIIFVPFIRSVFRKSLMHRMIHIDNFIKLPCC